MNGAQVVVEMLIRYETPVVFGLPGDMPIALYDALYAESKRITHVMARDERSAAFMADVYARLTGKPGVCEGTSGGGATYMLPGIAEAHGSSVPLIALPHLIRRAFRLVTRGRPGAVHLGLPKDVLAEEIPATISLHIEDACKSSPAHRTRPSHDAVSRAARNSD